MLSSVRYLLAAILAVLIFLQSELNVSHLVHIIIGAIIVVLGTLGVNKIRET